MVRPKIYDIEFPIIKGFKSQKLANGAMLHTMSEGTQPVIKTDIYIKAGSLKAEKAGLAKMTACLIGEGTSKLTSEEIAEMIDYRGAYISEISSLNYTHISVLCLSKHIRDIIQLVRDMIVEPSFAQRDIDIYQNRAIQELKVNLQKPRFIAHKTLRNALFVEGNRYGRTASLEDYDSITRDDIVDFHRKYYSPEDANIFISGCPTSNDIETISKILGETWNSEMSASTKFEIETRNAGAPIYVKFNEAKQASLAFGQVTIDVNHPDYNGLMILTTLFGGYFGSRLMSNLREEKGLTYGIGASLNSEIGYSILGITSELKAESIDIAINEIQHEMQKLQSELVEDEELCTLTNYIKGDIIRSFENSIATADTLSRLMLMGYAPDFNQQLFKLCDSITAKELMRLAQKYLNINDFQIVKVG